MKPRSLTELDPSGKHILLRVDFNSPIDPNTGRLLDDKRIRGHLPTVNALDDAALVLLSHQSRPGKADFTTLEPHAERLERLLDREVMYIDDIFGSRARDAVHELGEGEILLLENVRFYSEEYRELRPEEAAQTHIVSKLAPLFDAYVNDAFSAAHRSQASLIGFPEVLTSYAGKLMERELEVLGSIDEYDEPRVFSLGGAKAGDAFDVIHNVLNSGGAAEKVLVSGVVGNIFLLAEDYDPGEPTRDYLEREGYLSLVGEAEELLDNYGGKIETPLDVAVNIDGERVEAGIDEFPVNELASDIGVETIAHYSRVLEEAGTAIVNGPPGIYEEALFERGTEELFEAAGKAGTSIAGGGDTAAAIDSLDIRGYDHVSSGGGASTAMLSGKKLPAVEALASGS